MPANDYNALGYFESGAFMQFHEELLAAGGSNWHDWRPFNPGFYKSPAAQEYKRRAKELFATEFENSSMAILKDPRICRILPFWLEIMREMTAIPHIVIPIRSPLEVAKSLQKRDGMSLAKGLLLWLRHVLDAEAQSRTEMRSIFTWDDFNSDWRKVSTKIAVDVGLSWPRLSDRASYEIDHFLTQELIHHQTDHAELIVHSEVHEWTLEAYEALLELARNPFSNFAMDTLDRIRALVEQSSKIFGRILMDYEIELEGLQAKTQALASEQNEIRAESAALSAELLARAKAAKSAHGEALREKEILSGQFAAAIGARDALYADRERIAAELQAERQRLEESAALAAELLARAKAAESAHSDALFREGLSQQYAAAATNARDALVADHERIAAELQAERQKLEESAAATAELLARAEQGEQALGELLRDKEGLLHQLEATIAERDAIRAEREQIAAELQTGQQKLEQSAAATAELLVRAEQGERALGELLRDKEGLTQALAASAQELAEARRIEQTKGEHFSAQTAAHAQRLAEIQRGHETQISAMRMQLVDAEAAASNLKMEGRRNGMRALLRRRFQALQLIKSGLFDTAWYKAEYPDVKAKGLGAAEHYLEKGYCCGYQPNPLFETRWYLDRYEDVRRSGVNPLLHFLRHGYKEGRDPGRGFQTKFYLEVNPDVQVSGLNPLAHYLHYGRYEGRLPKSPTA
jgi:hypothetical protein